MALDPPRQPPFFGGGEGGHICVCPAQCNPFGAEEVASRERERPELESKAGGSGCQFDLAAS